MKKIILIILDGLGDSPIPKLKGKTPLESARTLFLDFMAKNGICGLAVPKFEGAAPTSEEGHFSLMGYDPKRYQIARGIITATGVGFKAQKQDVALRGNFSTIDEKMNMLDRRAGRIKNTKALIKAISGIKVQGIEFLIKSASEHRIAVLMRGKGLSPRISHGDPFYGELGKKARRIKALDKTKEAKFTAKVLNEFLDQTHDILKHHSVNQKRERKGLPVANYILTRGASSLPDLPSFESKYELKSCFIAGKYLYQQIGRILGMKVIKVRGATGTFDTNLRAKFTAVKKAWKKYDMVVLHLKAADSLAEDGDFEKKKEFIEKVDRKIRRLFSLENTLIVVTADHSTCSLLKRHCDALIPVLIFGNGKDKVKKFSEKDCKKGGLGKIKQVDLMKEILKLSK